MFEKVFIIFSIVFLIYIFAPSPWIKANTENDSTIYKEDENT